MARVALLVDFTLRTRVVVDIPDDTKIGKWFENYNNLEAVAQKAREQILRSDVESYLCVENMCWEEDTCE